MLVPGFASRRFFVLSQDLHASQSQQSRYLGYHLISDPTIFSAYRRLPHFCRRDHLWFRTEAMLLGQSRNCLLISMGHVKIKRPKVRNPAVTIGYSLPFYRIVPSVICSRTSRGHIDVTVPSSPMTRLYDTLMLH